MEELKTSLKNLKEASESENAALLAHWEQTKEKIVEIFSRGGDDINRFYRSIELFRNNIPISNFDFIKVLCSILADLPESEYSYFLTLQDFAKNWIEEKKELNQYKEYQEFMECTEETPPKIIRDKALDLLKYCYQEAVIRFVEEFIVDRLSTKLFTYKNLLETYERLPILRLYKVSLPADLKLGYGTYSEFVVVASSKEEARLYHPGSGDTTEGWKQIDDRFRSDWIKKDEINQLVVELLGLANRGAKSGIVCSSFHAG